MSDQLEIPCSLDSLNQKKIFENLAFFLLKNLKNCFQTKKFNNNIIIIIIIIITKKELQGRLFLAKRDAKLGGIEVLGPDYKSVEAVYSRT